MVRNAGEALGVLAWLDLKGEKQKLFSSSVQAQTLFEIEQLLAGQPPHPRNEFTGLNSPAWPETILPPIDRALAAKGEVLYAALCQRCHLPATTSPGFWTSDRWRPPNSAGEQYLDLEVVETKYVGTDSAQAADMQNRHVAIPPGLGIKGDAFGPALGQFVALTMQRWYDDQDPPISEARRDEMNGHRPNRIQAPLGYKARPLNGIWATPPYLHNGSVPNLYALLSPVAERPKKFYLGNREYDPVKVGYRTEELPGGFELDTSKRGNTNVGHEFNRSGDGGGVYWPPPGTGGTTSTRRIPQDLVEGNESTLTFWRPLMSTNVNRRHQFSWLVAIAVIGILACVSTSRSSGTVAHAQPATILPLSANDVSWLFPAPTVSADFGKMISMGDLSAPAQDPTKRDPVVPDATFQQFIAIAASPQAQVSGAQRVGLPAEAQSLANWFVAGVRIDAGAPGLSDDIQAQFGRTPEIRLIAQPVVRRADGTPQVLDIALGGHSNPAFNRHLKSRN